MKPSFLWLAFFMFPFLGESQTIVKSLSVSRADKMAADFVDRNNYRSREVLENKSETQILFYQKLVGCQFMGLTREGFMFESLLDDKKRSFGIPDIVSITPVSLTLFKKRDMALFSFKSSSAPAPGATSMELKGQLKVLCGSQVKTAKSNSVSVDSGTLISAGSKRIMVTSSSKFSEIPRNNHRNQKAGQTIPKPSANEYVRLSFQPEGDDQSIERVRFYNGSMELIGEAVINYADPFDQGKTVVLKEAPKTVTVEIDYVESTERVFPLFLKTSVGLN